jgi:hypothetical protein
MFHRQVAIRNFLGVVQLTTFFFLGGFMSTLLVNQLSSTAELTEPNHVYYIALGTRQGIRIIASVINFTNLDETTTIRGIL